MTIIAFVVVFTFIVFFHELGHFSVSRAFGVKVGEFGLGLPPRLFGLRRKSNIKNQILPWYKRWELIKGKKVDSTKSDSTIYSLNLLPIGGFVNIGKDDSESVDQTVDQNSFQAKSAGKRALILGAGVFMNVLLTVLLLAIVYMAGYIQQVPSGSDLSKYEDVSLSITAVLPGSPAAKAGLMMGDIINWVDASEFTTAENLSGYLSVRPDEHVVFNVDRSGQEMQFIAYPKFLEEVEKVGVGIGLANTIKIQEPVHKAFWYGLKNTGNLIVTIFKAIGTMLVQLVTLEKIDQEFVGPIGIAVITGQVARLGIVPLLEFAALLSINLAIINILPFPALDGGKILFIIIGKIRGKAVSQKMENIIHMTGFIILISLILVVTLKDIGRFGSGIWETVVSLF